MAYLPIENHGIIGNMHTVALVGNNGSIDWFCPQRFDAPSVFASILDDERGGHFTIAPEHDNITFKQMYWPDTNVLITRFLSEDGVAEVIDYMPVGVGSDKQRQRWLVRRVKMVRGSLKLHIRCCPAFNYARDPHDLTITDNGALFRSVSFSFGLSSSVPLTADDGAAVASLSLEEGEQALLSIQISELESGCLPPMSPEDDEYYFRTTLSYWVNWINQCTYSGHWREIVYRSALVLKLLTYEPTGAIVAAPTMSLPEYLGEGRNWDYRYTWIRDAAFTVYGFMRIGFVQEAAQFIDWVQQRMHELESDGSLHIMYRIDGGHNIEEQVLDHLSGYRGSGPVRLGNAAYTQLQLDIYGELMDSIYLYNKYGTPISYDLWEQIHRILDWICDNWQQKDKGIWEIRGVNQAFVFSKLMIWVALDRGVRLADKRSFPAPRQRWLETRDAVYKEIMQQGWNSERQAFIQYYGGDTLDAANLLMPLVFFVSPRDPRMLKTIDAINRPIDEGGLVADSLVYRYNITSGVDGLEGDEGTFNMCTFWLVEALTRAGKLDEARLMFEQMLGYANHLGLFAEETGTRGQALGNFPQAFTHLSLISAAFNLNRHMK